MTEKRFTTVELPKPNKWGIWYDGAYLSTYQVCILLNEYVDVRKETEQLKQQYHKVNNKLHSIDGVLEDLGSKKYISCDERLQALKKISKVMCE